MARVEARTVKGEQVAPPAVAVPRYRRCGQCSRCLTGTGRQPSSDVDCYAKYLETVRLVLAASGAAA